MPTAPRTIGHSRRREQRRQANRRYDRTRRDKEAQKFYLSDQWKAFRSRYLASIGGIQRPNGRWSARCQQCGEWTDTPEVHHIKPLRTHPELALDINNVSAWCKPCHSKEAQGLHPVTIVCGPPNSGKTTWVAEHKGPNDLVWDFDAIAEAMGFGEYPRPTDVAGIICNMREELLRCIRSGRLRRRAYLIVSDRNDAARCAAEVNGRLVEMGHG